MSEPRLRPAVRGLLVDPDERILLVRFLFPDRGVWAAPGGGIDPGETPLEALRRELDEEVGFVLGPAPEPPHVWRRPVVMAGVEGGWDGQTDDYYLVRCDAFAARGSLTVEQLRAEGMGGVRWWTRDELASASGAVFSPRALPRLLVELLRDGPPPTPLTLGL